MADDMTFVGFILAIFVFGIGVGKLIEKIERFINEKEDNEHESKKKNDHR